MQRVLVVDDERGVVLASALTAGAQDVPVEKYRLENGMTVLLHVDRRLPFASVNIWYRVGTRDDPPRRSGFAHLFEHLMFMGTERVPQGEFDRILETNGGGSGATTGSDQTRYSPGKLLARMGRHELVVPELSRALGAHASGASTGTTPCPI